MRNLKKVRKFLPLIGIAIFIYIIHDIGAENIISSLSQINPVFVALSFLIFIPRIAISTYKWQLIAKMQGIKISLLPLIKINLIGLFYGTITPLWVGDWIRIFYLRDESKECLGKCASNVIIDQLIEFFSLFILALFGAFLLSRYYPQLFFLLLAFFLLLLAMAIFFREKGRSEKIFRIVYEILIPEKMKESIAREFNAFYEDIPPISSLLIPLIIEIFSYILFFLQIYIVALSFNIDIPFLHFVLIYPISSLIGMIPITVSGLGTREGALIHLLAIYGVSPEIAVAISLSGYIITYLIPSIIGGIFAMMHEINAQNSG
ncbi:MAG: flippase-like domain-containing protein [Thermoplasmata archaeon]|nr:flippase-like domain-containing protein [Thermoplasmata archaeon]